jgi:hypothetical protein
MSVAGHGSTQAQLFNSLMSTYQAMGAGRVDRADALAPQPSASALPPRPAAVSTKSSP